MWLPLEFLKGGGIMKKVVRISLLIAIAVIIANCLTGTTILGCELYEFTQHIKYTIFESVGIGVLTSIGIGAILEMIIPVF